MTIACLNVCGLKSKLNYPEFRDFVSNVHILSCCETLLDDLDVVALERYWYLLILNGRAFDDKTIGNFTCRNASVADYTIVSANAIALTF